MRSHNLRAAAALGMLAIMEEHNPTVSFKRPGQDEWTFWPPESHPKAPTADRAPFMPCPYQEPGLIEHPKGCRQWNSVHFTEIRIGNRIWSANGWRTT